jgi:hypothetical protein
MSKKKRDRRREQWQTMRPDESFSAGPIRITRYGRYVSFENNATPEEHAAFQERMAVANKEVIADLTVEIAALQLEIQPYDPIELLHRAAYMLLPLFLKYYSENQYDSEETFALPAVEYLQYLIARTPASDSDEVVDEINWERLWARLTRVLRRTQDYLLTRRSITTPATEIDELRFIVDSRRFSIRIRRYPIYFADNLRDSLLPYNSAIRDAFGVEVEQLIRGLTEIHEYQKTGVIGRYIALRESQMNIVQKLEEEGHSLGDPADPNVDIRAILESPAFEALFREVNENARLTLTSAIFDISDVSSLPHSVLRALSVRPGESVLTSLTGPDHDDLSPLSISALHDKPFVEKDGRFFYFYHSGFEDRVADIIERQIFDNYPEREASLRRKRDDFIEAVACDLLASIIEPATNYRNVFYPNPDQPGTLTELDALLTVDDILFLVEVKAGGLSAGARRGAPESLYDELADTIGTGQRQSERAEKYINSADEVPFFGESGQRELFRIRRDRFRRIFRVVVTREDLGWVGARIAIMSVIEPTLSASVPWHVSIDDLRAVAELFQDSNLRFVHFLEQRLKASEETSLDQHDEIEHIGLYNKMNLYHVLPVQGMDRMTFDPSWMRDIDEYFSEKYRGNSPALPKQQMPPRLVGLLDALKNSGQAGRFAAASIILDTDEKGRNDLDAALGHLDTGADEGRQRSVRMPFSAAAHGITLSYARGTNWQQELVRSAAQMEQSRCSLWVAVMINDHSPYVISGIERIYPGSFSSKELVPGFHYIEELVRRRVAGERPGRNDWCPCGSGKKFKKCHGV